MNQSPNCVAFEMYELFIQHRPLENRKPVASSQLEDVL